MLSGAILDYLRKNIGLFRFFYWSSLHRASICDTPSAHIKNELNALAQALNTVIPSKNVGNLLIATWNIRRFGPQLSVITLAEFPTLL
jgi:hypothetical protein